VKYIVKCYAAAVFLVPEDLFRKTSTGIKAKGINEAINNEIQIRSDHCFLLETINDNNR
jgi:hypothetical protein